MKAVNATLVVFLLFYMVGRAAAFPIPERLEFDLSYTGVTAGQVVQEANQVGNEIQIVFTAKSADWLSLFFPVNDRMESYLISGTSPLHIGYPRLYQEQKHEGKMFTNREVRFDRLKHEATTIDHRKNEEKTQTITRRTYDALSSFFYFRTIPLQVGTSYFIDMYDCTRLWNTEVSVLRREELVTPLGRFKTIVVHPRMKSEGGIVKLGDIFIWMTDDARRIPVQMKFKVPVGSVVATLTGGSYWPGGK